MQPLSKEHKIKHKLTDHGADLPRHQHRHRLVVQVHVDDARPDGLAHLGPQQHGAQRLEDGRQDAGLLQRHHAGAHRRAERVGHVVGPHGERQDEGYDEAKDDHPQVRLQIHLENRDFSLHAHNKNTKRAQRSVKREALCVRFFFVFPSEEQIALVRSLLLFVPGVCGVRGETHRG